MNSSVPMAWRAYATAANTSSRVKLGYSARTSSIGQPAALFSRMISTVIRVPRMTGLPSMTSGRDCAKLDPKVEQQLANEDLETTAWPKDPEALLELLCEPDQVFDQVAGDIGKKL